VNPRTCIVKYLQNLLLRSAPILLASILALGSFVIAQRSQIRLWDNSPHGSLKTPDYFIENFSWNRFIPTQQKTNALQSTYAEHIPQDDLIFLKNINLQIENLKRPQIKIMAQQGELHNMNGLLLLTGNVTLYRGGTSDVELWLNTNDMNIDVDNEIIYARSRPTLKQGAHQITADEIIIKHLDNELIALNSVNVILAPKPIRN
jgi:LPS export ABC transporter protein LptC